MTSARLLGIYRRRIRWVKSKRRRADVTKDTGDAGNRHRKRAYAGVD